MDLQPNTNQVIQPAAQGSSNPSGELNAPAAPTPTVPKQPNKSSNKMILLVLLIVVILAVGAFLVLDNNSKKTATTPTPAAETVTAATTADLDQASKDLDTTLQKADAVKDVGAADLTDSSLGL